MKRMGLSAAVFAAALASTTASAETLRVDGIYPAGNDRAALLESIAVEQFGGVDGATLSIRVEDALRGAVVDGAQWFQMLPSSISTDADAVLRGALSTSTTRAKAGTKEISTCVRRDEDRKCVERRKQKISCRRLVVEVSPSLRLIGRGGDLVHTDDQEVRREERYCSNEDRPDADPFIEDAIDEIVSRVLSDLVPSEVSETIRVLESRKGMERTAGQDFRKAIRQTKQDEVGACQSFIALEPAIGEHESLLFNIGLCAEAQGDLDTAEAYYRRAIGVDGKNSSAASGLTRVRERRRADMQLDARFYGT